MSDKYSRFYKLLRQELVPAYGCTEPSALAYAAAYCVSVLGTLPDKVVVYLSGSVIKNIHSVGIPNAEMLKGPRAAAILGLIIGRPEDKLCILKDVQIKDIERAKELYYSDFCEIKLKNDYDGLYISVYTEKNNNSAEVTIEKEHTRVTSVKKNGKEIESHEVDHDTLVFKDNITLNDIIVFADNCNINEVSDVLELQIYDNTNIANEGLTGKYGVSIGKEILDLYGNDDVRVRSKAMAAAASEARMNGCVMPVVINSGSGNQGITASLPVIEFAKEYNVSHEKLLRSLCVANLVAIMQKKTVGNLSAFCGAVHAAAGAASGIAYLKGYSYKEISDTITYTLATIGGMICDGAKTSCAAKISQAIDTALMGLQLSIQGRHFESGDGLVKDSVEETIETYGIVGQKGMKKTNEVVLNLMLS